MTEPRTTRWTGATPIAASERVTQIAEGSVTARSRSRKTIGGKVWMASIRRLAEMSTEPPIPPLIRPIMVPATTAMAVAKKADVEREAGALGDAGEEVVAAAVGAEPVPAGGFVQRGERGVGAEPGGEEVVDVPDHAVGADRDFGGLLVPQVQEQGAVERLRGGVLDHLGGVALADGEIAVDRFVGDEVAQIAAG